MLTTTLIFITGVIIGVAAYHFYHIKFRQQDNLQQQLKQVKQQHTQYQQQVGEHFEKTAGMLQTLNQQYQGIEQHLQQGSEQFAIENIIIEASSNQAQPLTNAPNQHKQNDINKDNNTNSSDKPATDNSNTDNQAEPKQPAMIATPLDYACEDDRNNISRT